MNASLLRPLCVVACLNFALPLGAADPPKGQRVFTAGHSFHMMIPAPLAEMAKGANITGHEIAGTQGIGGSRTIQHWDLADDKNQVRSRRSSRAR